MCILLGIVRNISAARWLIINGNVLVNSIILKNYTTQINKGDIIQIKKFQLKQRRIRFNTQ
jgi:ribosomal protein S4